MSEIGKMVLLLFSFNNILLSLVIRHFYPIHFASQNLFFSDLVGFPITLPFFLTLICNVSNIIILTLIGSKFFNRYYFLPALIYSISPWSFYSTAFSSYYIYLLFLMLLAVYCLAVQSNRWVTSLFVGVSTIFIYSSFFAIFLLPLLVGLVKKRTIFIILILSLPILFFSLKNPAAVTNIYHNQVKIFSDPGLINNVNMFQGQSQKANLGILGKISENKYIYSAKFTILKFTKNIIPMTYFTSQEKLANFSFSPPVYVGFLIPFLVGLYYLLLGKSKYLGFSLLLIIPSLLSAKIADLNRLLLFYPVILYITSFGIIKLFDKNKIFKIILIFSIILIIIQLITTVLDINSREYLRFQKIMGDNLEIGKQ